MENQKVVVIGGSEGIGLAVAKGARALGADVLIVSRNPSKLEAARIAVPGLTTHAADINNRSELASVFARLDHLDHVYVSAGSTKVGTPLEQDLSQFEAPFNERVWGSVEVVRAAHSRMRPGGSFTFTGGLSSDRPVKGAWVSGIATAAAEQLARVLALELAPLRFNAIAPGWTDTPMWDRIFGNQKAETLQKVVSRHPIPRIVTADEVASAVTFLMQNKAITGEVIHIDCGARLV
ncbi:MAG: SDR family oxidoreductase [Bryobacteraceae bacterium]|nr:SDR family oxidoreductase [Bryobacteraceae bacterium]